MKVRAAILLGIVVGLAGCRTTSEGDWTGGAGTPFKQAERSCTALVPSIEKEADKRDFFIGCMKALGWSPKPQAVIEL